MAKRKQLDAKEVAPWVGVTAGRGIFYQRVWLRGQAGTGWETHLTTSASSSVLPIGFWKHFIGALFCTLRSQVPSCQHDAAQRHPGFGGDGLGEASYSGCGNGPHLR